MVEKLTERAFSPIELMRSVASTIDNNLMVAGAGNEELTSGGISMTTLGEKARILGGFGFVFTSGMASSSDLLERENMQLRNENLILRDTIRKIEERLSRIEASLQRDRVVVLRDVSREQAKAEIQSLFAQGKTLYYSDIAERLRLDLQSVVEVCKDLHESGEIEVVDHALRSG